MHFHRIPCRLFVLAALLPLSVASSVSGQFHTAELGVLSRSGGQAGTEFELAVATGSRIEEISDLWFSDPRLTAELRSVDPLPFEQSRRPDYGKFLVRIAKETPPGRYEVRAIGRHGITNPRLFYVSRRPAETPPEISHDQASPTPLTQDRWIHSHATAAETDCFAFTVDKGSRVRVDLLAQRLDSWLIGQLKVIAPDGRVVVAARGADGVDPELAFQAEVAGDYLLVVNDFLFRGGSEFFYQLLVSDGDRPPTLAAAGGLPRHLDLSTATASVGDDEPTRVDHPQDPNGSHLVVPPGRWEGRFGTGLESSRFDFEANKGDRYIVEIVSQRLGEPTDARLIVSQVQSQPNGPAKLRQVATADDSHNVGGNEFSLRSKDPVVDFTASEAGTYRITVQDLDGGVMLGNRQRFVLQIRKPKPRFDLVAFSPYPHKDVNQWRHFGSKLFRGGAESIRVLATRHDGWSGPIELSIKGLPAGVECLPATMAAGQTQTQLTLTATQQVGDWVGPIRIVGAATVDGQLKKQAAIPATIQWGRGHSREYIRSRRCDSLMLRVSRKDTSPLSIRFGNEAAGKQEDSAEKQEEAVVEVKKGETANIPVVLSRREGGKAACVLRPRDLPTGVTAKEVTVAADKSESTIELKIAANANPGTYSLWLQGETKIKVKPNPEALADAQAYRARLQKLQEDPAHADSLDAIKAAIPAADARVKAAEPAAKDQEMTVFLPTPHLTVRVVDP